MHSLRSPMTKLLIFMGYPWDDRATHTFSLFHAKRTYTSSIIILQCYFPAKKIFFENFGIRLLRQGRSLIFCSKPEICAYCTPCITCVEFQRVRPTRMWFFWELFSFFFAHFLASKTECTTPFILAHLVQPHVWACVRWNYTTRSRKYAPHVALWKISIFIGKSGFSGFSLP